MCVFVSLSDCTQSDMYSYDAHHILSRRSFCSGCDGLFSIMQVRAHQLVLPPCDVVIRAVADYVRNIQDVLDLEAIAKDIFKHSQVG